MNLKFVSLTTAAAVAASAIVVAPTAQAAPTTPPENLHILWNQFMDLEYETIAQDYFIEEKTYPVKDILPSFKKLLIDVPIASNATMSYWVDTENARHQLETGEDFAVGYRNDHTPLVRSFYLNEKAVSRNMQPLMKQFGVTGKSATSTISASGITYNGVFYEGYIDEEAQFHEGKYVKFPKATHTSSKPSATFAKNAVVEGMSIQTISKTIAVGSGYQLKIASNYPWYKPDSYERVKYPMTFKYGQKNTTIPYTAGVLAMSKNGYIKAKAVGTNVINVRLSSGDDDFYSVIVNVVRPVTVLKAPASLTVKVGSSKLIEAKANGTKPVLTYKTANKKIATVDSKGRVTGKKKGKTSITVTATTKDGSSKTKKVTVVVK